jgi:hypothetical protein
MLFALGMLRPVSKWVVWYALFAAIAMAVWQFYCYRRGYLYRGHNDKVYKTDEPKKFIFWLVLHTLVFVGMFVLAVYALLNWQTLPH